MARKKRKERRAPAADRNVYVIDLDPAVMHHNGFRRKNPDYVEGKPCVYVGMSIHPPEVRFEQHRSGTKSNRWAREFGRRVRTKRCHTGLTWNDAVRLERLMAERMRRRGWGVWQA